jgi:nucleoid DNA-binding protein
MSKKFTRKRIQEIIARTGLSCDKAAKLTDKIFEAMADALIAGEKIELRGFGTLEVKERKAYIAHNPQTGEQVITTPRRRVLFRPGHTLDTALRQTSQENMA